MGPGEEHSFQSRHKTNHRICPRCAGLHYPPSNLYGGMKDPAGRQLPSHHGDAS